MGTQLTPCILLQNTYMLGLCQNITITFCIGLLSYIIHDCIIFCSIVSNK